MSATDELVHKMFAPMFRLLEGCLEAYDNPKFRQNPPDPTTHCNQAVAFITNYAKNYVALNGKNANEIYDFLSTSEDWREIPLSPAEDVQELANQGRLIIAVVKGNPHGHCCVIRPGLKKTSPKWGCEVPAVVNIGPAAYTRISMGLSMAYQPDNKPRLFLLKETDLA